MEMCKFTANGFYFHFELSCCSYFFAAHARSVFILQHFDDSLLATTEIPIA